MPAIEAPLGAFPFVGKGGLRPSPRLGMAANTVRIIKTAGSRGLKLIAKHPIGVLSNRLVEFSGAHESAHAFRHSQ